MILQTEVCLFLRLIFAGPFKLYLCYFEELLCLHEKFTPKNLSIYFYINFLNYCSGAQSYRVVVRNIDDNEETNMEAEMQTITVIGLLPGTFYEIRVISIGALSVTNTNHSVFARAQTGNFFFQ